MTTRTRENSGGDSASYGVGDYRMSLVSAKRTIWLFLKGTP